MVKLWVALVSIAGAIGLWFSGHALHDLIGYWKLSALTPVNVIDWNVAELSPSRFGVQATYVYTVDGAPYQAKTIFEKPVYLNAFAAESDLKKWQSHAWQAWYRPAHPEISSLHKHFPAKGILHALLTLSIFTYFFFLRGMFVRMGNSL